MTNPETIQSFLYEKIRSLELFSKETSLINGPYITSPELDVKYLLAHILECDIYQLRAYYHETLSNSVKSQFLSFYERRKSGEPISKIIGKKEFWSHTYKVTKDTLDPRPDSETLIETVLKFLGDRKHTVKILDLGTGSGCLLLTLISELQNANGIGVDISDQALEIAKENAHSLGLDARASFMRSHWFETVSGKFDVIISNPPYIVEKDIFSLSNEVKKYDPMLALNGGKDGLDAYREIIPKLSHYLSEDGIFCFEIGFHQAEDISMILRENGFLNFKVIQDYGQQDRCIIGEARS